MDRSASDIAGLPVSRSETRWASWLSTESWAATFLCSLLVLAIQMLPLSWDGNEINYFELAHRFVSPGDYGPYHAAFDSSNARFLGFYLIGSLAELLGFDAAMQLMRWLMVGLFAAAWTYLVRQAGLSALFSALVLAVFIFITGQSHIGGEWIFHSVETKTFAYAAILAALGSALAGRAVSMLGFAVLAVYFHFLVGGFWSLAVIALFFIHERPLDYRKLAAHLGILILLISPLIAVIGYERLWAPQVGDGEIADNLNRIYAEYRAPHHVAPFAPGQLALWMPGIFSIAGISIILALLVKYWNGSGRTLALWLLCLHAYLALALGLAFIDAQAYRLAPFYMFRPSSLILLLSLMVFAMWAEGTVNKGSISRPPVHGLALLALALMVTPPLVWKVTTLVSSPAGTLMSRLSDNEQSAVRFIRTSVPEDAVILVGSAPRQEGLLELELLTDRPTLVNFKFVPTGKQDLARWYALETWHRDIFSTEDIDCARLAEQPVDYLLLGARGSPRHSVTCGRVVFESGPVRLVELD